MHTTPFKQELVLLVVIPTATGGTARGGRQAIGTADDSSSAARSSSTCLASVAGHDSSRLAIRSWRYVSSPGTEPARSSISMAR
jgi:hypothetical protein